MFGFSSFPASFLNSCVDFYTCPLCLCGLGFLLHFPFFIFVCFVMGFFGGGGVRLGGMDGVPKHALGLLILLNFKFICDEVLVNKIIVPLYSL